MKNIDKCPYCNSRISLIKRINLGNRAPQKCSQCGKFFACSDLVSLWGVIFGGLLILIHIIDFNISIRIFLYIIHIIISIGLKLVLIPIVKK